MQEATTLKKIIFWLITIAFPILLLGLLEIGFRIAGYQEDKQDLFIEYRGDTDYLVVNNEFVPRYFPSFKPNIAPNPFKKEKAPNTFRIFVFGGSSTQGFPYNFYYSFADQLEQKLLLNTNGVNVEVVNMGMTAVNSYVIRDLAKKTVEYEPDAVIIYAGHNEYYGSFGAGTTQFGLVNNITLKRLVLYLKNYRLFQFLENIMKAEPENGEERRTLMAEVVRESDIEKGSDVYDEGIKQFEKNIGSTIHRFTKEDIPVFIGTLASNLKDQAPLGDNEEALRAYEDGMSLFRAGDVNGAYEKFWEAKEADGIRFRAPQAINDIIIELSKEDQVTLIDVEKSLKNASESGIEDGSIFIDHLHPNSDGHRMMAEGFMNGLLENQKLKDSYQQNSFDVPHHVSDFEETYSGTAISRLLVGYPFTKGLTVQEELNEFNKIYRSYLEGSYADSIGAVTARNISSVPQALSDVINQARFENDSLTVISHYYELLKWQLNFTDLIERGIEYSVNNRSLDNYLVNMLTQVLNDGSYDQRYIDVLSSLYLLNNELNKAGYWLRESEKIDPDSPRMLYNFGRYHILRGDTVSASQYYSRYMNATRGNQ